MNRSLDTLYPNVAYFVDALGWIEIGVDDDSPVTSFIRALDAGGLVWEGEDDYPTLDAAFEDLEAGLVEWMGEVGIEVAEPEAAAATNETLWENVDSSMISAFGYNEAEGFLDVAFHRTGVYRYFDVTKDVVDGLRDASSKGSYMRSMIIDTYEYAQR